jgi:hypothetical protein
MVIQLSVVLLDEVYELNFEGYAKGPQLHHVDAAFAGFNFIDKTLRVPESATQFDLSHSGTLPRLSKMPQEDYIFGAVDIGHEPYHGDEEGIVHLGLFRL